MKIVCCYGLYKSSTEEIVTDAEVSGHRFQPRRQRHVLEDRPEASGRENEDKREAEQTKDKLAEMLSTDGGAESICWCGDSSLSAVMKWLQLGSTQSMLVKVNIKLSVIVIAYILLSRGMDCVIILL